MRRIGFCTLALLLVCASVGVATDSRLWTDSTGKFQIEAEFVSAAEGMVVLRTREGKEITFSSERLSEQDQAFLKDLASTKEVSNRSPLSPAELQAKAGDRELAAEFYDDLRTQDRSLARDTLTAEANALVDDGKSALTTIPKPVEGKAALRVGNPKVSGKEATVPCAMRLGRSAIRTTLNLR